MELIVVFLHHSQQIKPTVRRYPSFQQLDQMVHQPDFLLAHPINQSNKTHLHQVLENVFEPWQSVQTSWPMPDHDRLVLLILK